MLKLDVVCGQKKVNRFTLERSKYEIERQKNIKCQRDISNQVEKQMKEVTRVYTYIYTYTSVMNL